MWREIAAEAGLETTVPASPEAVRAIEEALACTLPDSLRSLLLEIDGLTGSYELEVVMRAEAIVSENVRMRTTEDLAERLHLGPRGRQPVRDRREPGALPARRELVRGAALLERRNPPRRAGS